MEPLDKQIDFIPTTPEAEIFVDSLQQPFAELIHDLVNYGMHIEDENSGLAIAVEDVSLDMPVEIGVTVDDEGKVTLHGSPPTQLTETTTLPVFHQMKLKVVRDDE
ncbi:MAG: hypothetical protein AAGA80_26030 [Cyanobacteria bacterium P01_F01_bin.143]